MYKIIEMFGRYGRKPCKAVRAATAALLTLNLIYVGPRGPSSKSQVFVEEKPMCIRARGV